MDSSVLAVTKLKHLMMLFSSRDSPPAGAGSAEQSSEVHRFSRCFKVSLGNLLPQSSINFSRWLISLTTCDVHSAPCPFPGESQSRCTESSSSVLLRLEE